jgi:plastocyanin
MALSILLSGCFLLAEEQNVTQNVTPPPPPPPPPPAPSFTITSPTNGEIVMAQEETGDVTVIMSTTNLLLRPEGGAMRVGEGHFKFTLDGQEMGTAASKIYTLSDVELGSHSLDVELVHNDGTSYVPRIYRGVSFTLEQEEPEVYVPQEHAVTVKDFEYEPQDLTIKQTDSVTWTNEGNFPRSATCFIEGQEVFSTGVLANGDSATVTFDDIMECEYYSTTHPIMKGKIKVESNGME